ncbi:MAG: hypothetical protein NTW59_01780 [Candidatus Diapherotrites archaeon]|nr:hypothetical protein [Candidatus Diapherotrites archaeon]
MTPRKPIKVRKVKTVNPHTKEVREFKFAATREGRELWKRHRPALRRVFIDENIHHLKKIGHGSHGDVYEFELEGRRFALKVFGRGGEEITASENGIAQMLAAEEIHALDLRFEKAKLTAPKPLITRPKMLLMEMISDALIIKEFRKQFAHNQQLLDNLEYALGDFSFSLDQRTARGQYRSMVAGDRARARFDQQSGELFVFMLE